MGWQVVPYGSDSENRIRVVQFSRAYAFNVRGRFVAIHTQQLHHNLLSMTVFMRNVFVTTG